MRLGRPLTVLTAAACAAAVTVPSAAVAAGNAAPRLRPVNAGGPLGNELLSNERTLTRWASPYERGPIRSAPRAGARRIGQLRLYTEDGPLEVYLALRSQVDSAGRAWIQIRIPGRPNGRKGWVRESSLGALQVVRTRLIVDRRTLKATLTRSGKVIWSSRVGVGKASTPTPRGHFWIRTRLHNLGGAGGPYGPWAFGTAAYSKLSDWPGGGVVGLHGTNEPGLIPGRPSHGCIRVPNDKVRKLARLLPVGTPLLIR